MLRIGVRVDIAEVHFRSRRRHVEHDRIKARLACYVARRLRSGGKAKGPLDGRFLRAMFERN